jgi:hypothetical protein
LDDDQDTWRSLSFEIRASAPQRVGAHVDSELWALLTQHYVQQIRVGGTLRVRRSAIAVVALAMEEIVAIDDMDPRDAFDDYAEYDNY